MVSGRVVPEELASSDSQSPGTQPAALDIEAPPGSHPLASTPQPSAPTPHFLTSHKVAPAPQPLSLPAPQPIEEFKEEDHFQAHGEVL